MMQVWFTAQELADASTSGLIRGLPTTKFGINKLINREGWDRYTCLVRPRAGREGGGGFEYHIEQLPMDIRLSYIAAHFNADIAGTVEPTVNDHGLTGRAKLDRDAKQVTLRLAGALKRSTGLSVRAADEYFARLFNGRSIDIPEWVAEVIDALSARTLARWRSAAREDANSLGYDPSLSRKGTGLLDCANDGAVRIFIFGLIAKRPLSAKEVRKQCRFRFGEELADRNGEMKPMPELRAFQYFLKTLKAENEVVLTKITDPDKSRSHHALSGTGAFSHVTTPNQLWQIDASPVDALCVDGRHSIYICIDLATRRIAIHVSRTPRASAVGLMVRKAILAWGVASEIKTDNGSDFVAKETVRLFDSLKIDVLLSAKYSPQEKGHVERVIKTFQHQVGPLLPGYIGHNVAERKAIENRKSFAARLGDSDAETFEVSLTGAELQEKIDQWVEYDYHQSEHEGLGKRSPHDVAAASDTPIRRVDERALDVLLMPIAGNGGLRVMTKRGIRTDHFHYMTGQILPGTQVLVRHDPHDAGRILAFTPDGSEFLAEAICPKLAGISPQTVLQAARELQKEIIDETMKPVKAAMRELTKGPSLIDRSLEISRRDAEAKAARSANVIRLPKREETHSSPQISAALAVFSTASTPPQAPALDDGVTARHRALIAELGGPTAGEKVTPLRVEETAAHRFGRMMEIERRRDAGAAITADEAYELGSYQQSAEYKTRKAMMEDFGDQAPVLRT